MSIKSATIKKEFQAIQAALEVLEPLNETQREFAISMILARLGMQSLAKAGAQSGGSTGAGAGGVAGIVSVGGTGDAPTKVREFLRQKNPVTDLERYLCLAYYLTRHMNTPTFTSKDITKLNGEAGGHDFSNAAVTAGNATQQSKLLSRAGGGKKRITLRGEQLVEALPDRAKAKEITKSRAIRKRAKRKPTKG